MRSGTDAHVDRILTHVHSANLPWHARRYKLAFRSLLLVRRFCLRCARTLCPTTFQTAVCQTPCLALLRALLNASQAWAPHGAHCLAMCCCTEDLAKLLGISVTDTINHQPPITNHHRPPPSTIKPSTVHHQNPVITHCMAVPHH